MGGCDDSIIDVCVGGIDVADSEVVYYGPIPAESIVTPDLDTGVSGDDSIADTGATSSGDDTGATSSGVPTTPADGAGGDGSTPSPSCPANSCQVVTITATTPQPAGDIIPVADWTVTADGFYLQPSPAGDQLDPKLLNKPITPAEQAAIANALTIIINGKNVSTLNPHSYLNWPDPTTGAVLPVDMMGLCCYTTYYVRGLSTGPGTSRVIIGTNGSIYYTNNHYRSFYAALLNRSDNMRLLILNATDWKSTAQVYDAILCALDAPAWSGRNINGLIDSMIWDDKTKVKPPYTIIIKDVSNYIGPTLYNIKAAISQAKEEYKARYGRDIAIYFDIK